MASPPVVPAAPRSPRRKGAVTLGALVPDAVASALRERGFASTAIMTEWREIVGPHLARWTHPVELRWPRRASDVPASAKKTGDVMKTGDVSKAPSTHLTGAQASPRTKNTQARRATLVIACPGAFALDVQMASPGIIEAVNRRLGFGCVGALQIHQTPRPAPVAKPQAPRPDPALIARLDAAFSDIERADLRHALALWGAGIALRNAK